MNVAVVILNYRVGEKAIECVESVKNSSYKDTKIYLLDNDSGDDSVEKLKKISDVEFIQNTDNLGYSGGNNIGIKKALEDGAEYVLVLNPDTVIDKNCIQNLVEGMEKNNAGIVGPKIYFKDSKTIWHAGGEFDFLNVIGSHIGVDEKDNGQYDNEAEVDFVSGAAILIKREVFEKIGFFDERYFLYYEDSDFCLRAKKAGFKIMYIPKALVFHENAASAGLGSPLQDYYITRNRMLFAKKFLSFRTQFALFREGLRNLGNPVRRLAFWDFLTGNFGRGSL